MNYLQYDRLDAIATDLISGDASRVGVLSTGEALYVALAANNAELLRDTGFTIVQAIARLDEVDIAQLIMRWKCR